MPAVLTLPRIQPMNLLPCFLASAAWQRRRPTQRAAGCDLPGGCCLVLRVRPPTTRPHAPGRFGRSCRQGSRCSLSSVARLAAHPPARHVRIQRGRDRSAQFTAWALYAICIDPGTIAFVLGVYFFIVLPAESTGASCVECGKRLLRVFGGPASETNIGENLTVKVVGNLKWRKPIDQPSSL